VVVLASTGLGLAGVLSGAQPRFFPDDPIWTDDDMALDASGVGVVEDTNAYDFVINTFGSPGERRDVRALNVNTVDEVPDSSWFVNRIGRRPMSIDEIVRGPDQHRFDSLEGWVVTEGKSSGVQAGFRRTAPDGHLYQIEFDPPEHPEMATGAEMIGTAFYHAFGYHTVEVFLTELDPDAIVIAEGATIKDPLIGERRPLTRKDIDDVLRRSARLPDGRYRVLASRFAEGRYAGNFRYYGTRPDDPNDIFPHERRRELRGARVFGAWLNHDDSRGVNSLDFVTDAGDGRQYVKHYMFDFGSILGSGTKFAQRHRAGHEYILEWRPGWLTLATLGLYTRPWLHIDYPEVPPSIGRFEAEAFDPEAWKPEYPNPAFDNMREDDAFWAARIVAAFSDEAIRAVVEKARYSDPRATDFMTQAIITRRDKVARRWLTGVNPLVDVALDSGGRLTFVNAAVEAGVATPAEGYRLEWLRFDNVTGEAALVSETTAGGVPAQAPPELAGPGGPAFIEVRIAADHPDHPAWAVPVTAHFRRTAGGWELVGLERLP
jgi:hypothetical protein